MTHDPWETIMVKKLQKMEYRKHSKKGEEKEHAKPEDANTKGKPKGKPAKGKHAKGRGKPTREKFFQKEEKPKSTVVNYVLYELNNN